MAILVASSELEELVGICHRIVVLRRGRITAELERSEFSKERIIAAAAIDQSGGVMAETRATGRRTAQLPRRAAPAGAARAARLADSPEIGIIVALIVAFIVFTCEQPAVRERLGPAESLGVDLAGFGILAIGESFAIITGGIDLSRRLADSLLRGRCRRG